MPRPIVLYENLRAPAYIPYYLAWARGAFAAEGVEVEMRLSPAPRRTAEALLDGEADVSWGGPMRVMLHHDRDPLCPLVCFCLVVGRDPFVLVGREPNPGFRLADLAGARVGVVSEVPTPWMCFQDDLRRAGLDPDALDIRAGATMAENAEALRRGELDAVQVFEPVADGLLARGAGHVWLRFADRGPTAYTTFYTTNRFAEQERETCRALSRAMARALEAVAAEPAGEVAAAVAGFFPDLSVAALSRIVERFRAARVWTRDTALPPGPVVNLKGALLSGGLIATDPPYERVVAAGLAGPERPSGAATQ